MTAPVVAVGCPVRNRAWVLPRYLKALAGLQYPADRLRFGFVVNDSQDETEQILRMWERNSWIEVRNLGYPSWRRSQGYSLHNLARLRNRLIDWFLSTDGEYLFSVDSDILVPPDSLERLLANRQPIVSLLVQNTPSPGSGRAPGRKLSAVRQSPARRSPRIAYNVMFEDEAGNLRHFYDAFPSDAIFRVAVTGAAYLIRRDVLEEGVRYAYDPQGEDVPFCRQARDKGFDICCDARVRARHLMDERE